MAYRSTICFSSHTVDSQTITQNQGPQGGGTSGGSFLAQMSMVLSNKGDGPGSAHPPTNHRRHVDPGTDDTPSTRLVSIDRLAFERSRLQRLGYSAQVMDIIQASRRPSMNRIYNTMWKAFVRWCNRKQVSPLNPKIQNMLSFLQDGVTVGLKAPTLRRQTVALASVLPRFRGFTLTKHPHILQFLRGVALMSIRATPPSSIHRFPTWHLNTVLSALTRAPFEPAHSVQLKYLRMKTIFLIAITSARNVLELGALSIKTPLCIS